MSPTFRSFGLRWSRRLALGLCLGIAQAMPASAASLVVDGDLEEAVDAYWKNPSDEQLQNINGFLAQGKLPSHAVFSKAVIYKRPDLLDALLAKSVEQVNRHSRGSGETLLMIAMSSPGAGVPTASQLHMVEALLRAGADVNLPSLRTGATPLMYAAGHLPGFFPDMGLVNRLLVAGADARMKTKNGDTVLTGPAAGHLELLERLIAAGADPHAETKDGMAAVDEVCTRQPRHRFVDQPDPQAARRISLVAKSSAELNLWPQGRKRKEGKPSPLMAALRTGNPDCVRSLVDAGARWDGLAYAYPTRYRSGFEAIDPITRIVLNGKSVRQMAQEELTFYPDLYSPETLRLIRGE